METFKINFLGTNGSCAYNNGKRKKYGSNTMCIAVAAGDDILVIDSGSGINGLSGLESCRSPKINLLFSHYHVDHIEGLLFCKELFDPQKEVVIYGCDSGGYDVRGILENYLSPPISPAGFKEFKALIDFKTIKGGDTVNFSGGAKISACSVSHPGGALGYRVEYNNKSFCACCDVELGNHTDDTDLLEFISGADLLVFDSFFDDDKIIPGWGHSSWRESAELAKKAGVKRLALLHYSPSATDDEIDDIQKKARAVFPGAITVADHMTIDL